MNKVVLQRFNFQSLSLKVPRRINQKGIPATIDPADTITLKDLDDDFAAAEVDSTNRHVINPPPFQGRTTPLSRGVLIKFSFSV